MIRRIQNSLTAKIFLLTAVLLLLVSVLTYGSVSFFLPSTYRHMLSQDLQRVSEELGETLAKYDSVDNAANLLELFAANNQASVTLLDGQGEIVYPQDLVYCEEAVDAASGEASGEAVYEFSADTFEGEAQEEAADMEGQVTVSLGDVTGAGRLSGTLQSAQESYPVEIGGEEYTMLVSGTMQSVSQTQQILYRILPTILLLIGAVSLLCALFASLFLTRPIMALSRVSRKMARLEFDETCSESRSDEVGVLGRSLNELAANLGRALEGLEEANRKLRKDMERERSFFAAVSHELKTPVTVLKGHLGGMCQNLGAYKDRDYYLERSYRVTQTMENLVGEILAVTRMESGAWEAKKCRTDLAELARLQAAELTGLLEEKNQEWELNLPDHLNWRADPGMMEKIFRNLLSNGITYSPAGAKIRIWMRKEKERLLFWVENTGVRLPEESLERLFDPFYRVEGSRNRALGGSGLGLYIVKKMVRLHGGECGAENSREGVRVWFSLGTEQEENT